MAYRGMADEEILRLLAHGHQVTWIAEATNVSPRTVQRKLRRLEVGLGCTGKGYGHRELVTKAFLAGLF